MKGKIYTQKDLDDAHESGYNAGHQDGYHEGYEEGYDSGSLDAQE